MIYDELPPEGKKLARIPRYAKLLGLMSDKRIKRVTSTGMLYWEVFSCVSRRVDDEETGLLDTALRNGDARTFGCQGGDGPEVRKTLENRRWQCRLAMGLLGALAIEMFFQRPLSDTQNSKDRFKVPRRKCVAFRNNVLKRFKTSAYVDSMDEPIQTTNEVLQNHWRKLQVMNSGIKHLLLGGSGPSQDGHENEDLFFSNITIQTFFAAYWAVRWASDEDRARIKHWIPDPHRGRDHRKECREFWEIVLDLCHGDLVPEDDESSEQQAEPPTEGAHREEDEVIIQEKWELLLSPLFDGSLAYEDGEPIRSTELMYRTWGLMEGTAARKKFSGEFEEFINGSDKDKKRVALELLYLDGDPSQGSQFIRLADPEGTHTYGSEKPPVPDWHQGQDDGRFPTGGAVKQFGGDRVEPFLLSRVCVTNDQFELFDRCRRRRDNRAFTDKLEIDATDPDGILDRHPVVKVSWLDSAVFCFWLSEYFSDLTGGSGQIYELFLPDERSWEYGCRCGLNTAFTWGDPDWDNDRIESGWCNFEENLGRTIDVRGEDAMLSVPSNPWGFHQLHGNVWEHCLDWLMKVAVSRVLRGGSWILLRAGLPILGPQLVGSGRRTGSWSLGLRLAAVPRAQERPVSVDADESMSRAEHDSESDDVKRD